MNQSAQGLASLGRGNDSMLVHMTPREVEGLQGLAMAHGGSLTINPQTGLPEAGFLDAVLPMAAGFALGPGGFGLFSGANAALMAGLTVGGLTALTSGDIGKGLMAGFGAYGGSGLGDAIKSFGANAGQAGAGTTGEFMGDALAANKINVMNPSGAPGVNVFSGAGAPGITLPKYTGATGFGPSAVGNTSFLSGTAGAEAVNPKNLLDLGSGAGTTSATNLIRPGASSMPLTDQSLSQGFSNVLSDPSGFAKEYGTGKLALQGGSLALEALNPEIEPEPFYTDPEKGKYRGPQGQLNLSDRFDTGLRLAEGGTISTGGIRNLYGSSDNQTQAPVSADGYGLGRLSNLANEQAMTTAQTLGYAEGGDVSGSLSADVAAEIARSGIDPALVRGDMVDDAAGLPYVYDRILTRGALDARRIPPIEYSPYTYAGSLRKPQGYAEGGDVSNYRQDQAALNFNELPTLNTVTGEQIPAGGLDGLRLDKMNPLGQMYYNLISSSGIKPSIGSDKQTQDFFYNPFITYATDPQTQQFRKLMETGRMAKGGYLDGQGDGMSDSIPATIEGKQPARLADGEFVVPADVVSHIGNGSSKAGSKRLYAMMDKVRHARTGNKKQGKQIKPEKYMPA